MRSTPYSLRLTDQDRELARAIGEHIGSDMTGAIRYALRETARTIERSESQMLNIEIRQTNGETIATGRGREFAAAVTRLYNEATSASPRRRIATSQWFPTDQGQPYGTWHVQMGYNLAGSTNLDSTVIVHVS